MKAYIRNKTSHRFYAGCSHWRTQYRRARAFHTVPEAANVISQDHLRAVEIVLIEPGLKLQITFSNSRLKSPIPAGANDPEP